jgi:uncharacterized protein (TIGR03067 family)
MSIRPHGIARSIPMKLSSLALTIGLLLTGAVSAAEDADKKELEKLKGTWTITSDERGSPPVAKEKNPRVIVAGNQFTTEFQDKVIRKGTLKLDPTQNPRAIDVTYTEGEFKGKTLHGIYTLEKDIWTICYSRPGEERPRELPKKPGKTQILLTLKRGIP